MTEISRNFSQAEVKIRQEITKELKEVLGKDFSERSLEIDYPPKNVKGDFSLPCFSLSKKLKKPPLQVAQEFSKKIRPSGLIKGIKAVGPYLNFFVDQVKFNKLVLTEIFKAKDNYGSSKVGKGKRIMIEYFSPNTNKPLTIGHIRNICLGFSLSRIMKFLGYKVIESTLYNDRGIAIAKAIVGYQKWGNNQAPKDAGLKPDHFVGNFYVKFSQAAKTNPNLEQEAKRVLQQWEEGKKEVNLVWQKLMRWVLQGFDQTLDKLGVNNFEEKYYESEYYKEGKQIVEQGLKKSVFVKDKDGVILAPLEKYGLAPKILLRPDETSLYITQDLYLAYLKDKHNLDESIYVVGSEQDLYFKQLFKILELLDFKNTKNYYHLSYGMVRLPSGRIKSREGLVKGTGADELIAELEEMAIAEIKSRFSAKGGSQPKADAPLVHASGGKDLEEKAVSKRAEQIALSALKFFILAVNPQKTMVFEPKKSLAFTGRTGPYLQYVHARINSIFAKAKIRPSIRIDFASLNHQLEFELIKLLARFPAVIKQAAKSHDPSQLANYLHDLAKAFSLFYEQVPILKAEAKVKKARLLLIDDVKIVLATGLQLLGIEAPEKM